MQQFTSTTKTISHSRARVVAAADDQQALMRGLVNGIILSMALWIAAGYLTFVLR